MLDFAAEIPFFAELAMRIGSRVRLVEFSSSGG